MKRGEVETEVFLLKSGDIRLRVFIALPQGPGPFPSVQIHHAGGGYEPIYEEMAVELAAAHGIAGVAMIHRGYPGSEGQMEYGKGEIDDIVCLTQQLQRHPRLDPGRMGIMGYSRGAHNALLAIERCDAFCAGALWSTPVDMFAHVELNPWIAEMIGGWPDEVPEEYRIRSSILFADRINCPLLLLHGEADDVVPVHHTQRLAHLLRELGKPVTVRIFPGEGHIWSPTAFALNWRLTVAFFHEHFGMGQN